MSIKHNGKAPDLFDILLSVQSLDKLRKGTPEYEKLHKTSVQLVEAYNNVHGKDEFSINLGRARQLNHLRDIREKRKIKMVDNRIQRAQKKTKKPKKKDGVVKKDTN